MVSSFVCLVFLLLSSRSVLASPVLNEKRQFNKPTVYTTELSTALPTVVTTSTSSVDESGATISAAAQGPTVGQPLWNLASLDVTNNGPLELQVSLSGGNASSSNLYGIILEDIDHSVDGGLYAELIQNRAFQDNTLDSWLPFGGASIALNYVEPLSSALEANLIVDLSQRGYGFENTGWWGFSVREVQYRLSFWAKTTTSTSFTVTAALQSASDGTQWVSADIILNSTSWNWYEIYITPSQAAPDNNNVFVITSNDDAADTVQFQLISLFPPTYNNRPNGVRPDLMQNFLDLNLRFCRVPGGNNLEGETTATRWIWNNTIGLLRDRPGRQGTWGYYNTDGMGLFEWAQFCEDLGADFLLGVWAGYSLDADSIAEGDLQPYIDEVLNEIEYLVGAETSTYGALRVADGRADPFDLKYVEIGNEDFFSSTYYYRWPAYYSKLVAAYPNITFVATTVDGIVLDAGVVWDQHQYASPLQFEGLFSAYDNWPRNNGTDIIVGEYANQRFDNNSYAPYPFVDGSIAEAVYSLGIERNSEVVLTQLYAPFLANVHYDQQAKPRLITFDNDPSNTIFSTSYYAFQLLSTSHGTNSTILPVTANIGFHPLYWVASSNGDGIVYVKLANAGASSQSVSISGVDGILTSVNATVLTGDQYAANTPENPTNVLPADFAVTTNGDGTTSFTVPAWALLVIAFSTQSSVTTHLVSTTLESSATSTSSSSTASIMSATVSTTSTLVISSSSVTTPTATITSASTTSASPSTVASSPSTPSLTTSPTTSPTTLPSPSSIAALTTTATPITTASPTTTATTTTSVSSSTFAPTEYTTSPAPVLSTSAASTSALVTIIASLTATTSPTSTDCPADLSGNYQFPHLIIPINSTSPATAYGTQYLGTVSPTISTIFDFDIPASYAGSTCTLIFLLPLESQLTTSNYTTSGTGGIEVYTLSGVATEETTYANAPAIVADLGSFVLSGGSSMVISSGSCAAGERVSYELRSTGDYSLEWFEDYGTSPIGLFITEC